MHCCLHLVYIFLEDTLLCIISSKLNMSYAKLNRSRLVTLYLSSAKMYLSPNSFPMIPMLNSFPQTHLNITIQHLLKTSLLLIPSLPVSHSYSSPLLDSIYCLHLSYVPFLPPQPPFPSVSSLCSSPLFSPPCAVYLPHSH